MWGGYGGYDSGFDMGYNQGLIYPSWDGYGKGAMFPMKGAGKGGKGKWDGKGGKGKWDGKGGKGMWVMMPAPVWNAPKGKGGKKGGKGGGQQGGGSKKRKKENSGPVQSIDGSMVEQITNLLNENGGEMSLGRVTTVFPGLKKVQVEEHFNVQEVGDGDFTVTNGIGAGPMVSGEKREKVKKEKKAKKENGGPVQSIDESMVEQITNLLNENGGEISLGRMTTVFPGLKKTQVEEHFNVQEVGDGNFTVTNGIGAGPMVSGERREKVKKEKRVKKEKDPDAPPPPDLESDVLNEITAHLEACGGSCVLGKLCSKFQGLKKAQLEGHFEVENGEKDSIVRLPGHTGDMDAIGQGPAKKRKKERQRGCFNCGDFAHMSKECTLPRKEKGSNDAPPPDLEHTKVQKISDYLSAAGGSAPLGKVTTMFPGVKKAQLESNFALSGGGANSDPIVSLS